MKRTTLGYVALIALLVAPVSLFGMNQPTEQKKSAISGKSLLALLGTTGAVYGTYHVYNSPELSQKVKDNFALGRKWAEEHKVAVGCGVAAIAAAGYLGYRWMNAEKDIVIDTSSYAAPLVAPKAQKSSTVSEPAVQLPAWYAMIKDLVVSVCRAKTSSDDEARALIAPIAQSITKDPYAILSHDSFIEGLNAQQRAQLAQIFALYKDARMAAAITALERALTPEQDGLKALLQEALAGGADLVSVAFNELENAQYLSPKQAQFVKNELNYYKELASIDANYAELYLARAQTAARR